MKEVGSKLLRPALGAVLGVCLKQSQDSNKIPAFPSPCSQPTGRVSLPNVEVLSFIEVHSFLTFAHFPPSISHMGAQASPACSAVFDLCTRKSVSSQLHISKQIKFALVVHLKPDRSPFVRFVVQDPKPAKPHSPSGSLSTRGLLQWGLAH